MVLSPLSGHCVFGHPIGFRHSADLQEREEAHGHCVFVYVGQDGLRRQGQGGPEVGQGPDGGEERGW